MVQGETPQKRLFGDIFSGAGFLSGRSSPRAILSGSEKA